MGCLDLPSPQPDWERTRLYKHAGYDLYKANWRSGWVWMAIVARGDGTFLIEVGRTRFKYQAKRQADERVIELLWRRSQEIIDAKDQASTSQDQTPADAQE